MGPSSVRPGSGLPGVARRRVAVITLLITAGAGALDASAQSDDDEIYIPKLRSGDRKIIGGGFGIGMFSGDCADCLTKGGLAAEFYGGYQITERIAVIGQFWSTIHVLPFDTNPGIAGYFATNAAAQVWLTPTVYLRAGLGLASFAILSDLGSGYDLGPGLVLTLGGELGHRPNSGIDLSAATAGSYVQSSALGDFLFLSAAALVSYHRN